MGEMVQQHPKEDIHIHVEVPDRPAADNTPAWVSYALYPAIGAFVIGCIAFIVKRMTRRKQRRRDPIRCGD